MMRSEYLTAPPLMNNMHNNKLDPNKKQVIAELLKESGNSKCADCAAQIDMENAWAVLSYGILVCDDCKLVHIEHQNHYKSPDDNEAVDNGLNGILSTQFAHVWEEKDITQIKTNGNKRVNDNFLKNVPIWQYRPSANDGIKLKEYWITCKYSGKAGEGAENPIRATKKSFLGFQFIRPMPEGNSYHCCAVLQNDVLYLTSDKRNEEVPLECIETVIVNSKRIGHENGVQLTYRTNKKDANIAAYTYLQHESMETVMTWVNLVLYSKYNLFKKNYPSMTEETLSKILNCGVVKESYSYIQGYGLIYISVSEARLCCFKHHLDDQPLFQMAVSEVMNLSATQYLDALACNFNIDANKIQSYADWYNALELVLKTDKLASMPDTISLLKKSEKPYTPAEKVEPSVTVKEKNLPVATVTSTAAHVELPSKSPPPPTKTKNDNEKDKDQKKSNYECYPPIGPMGEMGKVFRGELSPEAIKPPPSKNDIARMGGVLGDYIPQLAQVPLPIKSANYNDLIGQAGLTSFASTLNHTNSNIINQNIPKEAANCYPPIGGPVQTRKLQQYDVQALNAFQTAHLCRDRELNLEELRSNPTLLHNPLLRSTLTSKPSLFDQARLPNALNSLADPSLATAGFGPSHYGSWGDATVAAAAENLLTVPWKPTTNGYEPARSFNANTQYQDLWNSKLPAAAPFGTWGGRSTSVDLAQQAMMGRNLANWGGGMAAGGGIDHWTSKTTTNLNDPFLLANSRDIRAAAAAASGGLFGTVTGGRNSALNGSLRSRTESPSGGGVAHANVVVDNLYRQWQLAEQKLLSLIHNAYVPALDVSPANGLGLDKDSSEHAYTCVNELFDLLWKQRYDVALSFLRGFREVFAHSIHPEIRNQFIGAGELDTMRQIFLQQGKEKFLSTSTGGPVQWKQPTPPPVATQAETSWPPSSRSVSVQESSSSFSPWGGSFAASDPWSVSTNLGSSTRSASISSDPWNTSSSMFSGSSSAGASTFNRAPSRPSHSQSSNISDNSPAGGSKASSDSASPRAITPTSNYDAMLGSNVMTSHIESLKNLFLGD